MFSQFGEQEYYKVEHDEKVKKVDYLLDLYSQKKISSTDALKEYLQVNNSLLEGPLPLTRENIFRMVFMVQMVYEDFFSVVKNSSVAHSKKDIQLCQLRVINDLRELYFCYLVLTSTDVEKMDFERFISIASEYVATSNIEELNVEVISNFTMN